MPITFERTWQQTWNTVPADATTVARQSASFLWFMLSVLTGNQVMTDIAGNPIGTVLGKWTIAGSGNGAAGAMDTVDRLNAAAFTAANWVNGTGGSAHSWFVLKSPTSGYGPGEYLIVSWSSGSGVYFANFTLCKTAPTGGSATADPTTTDATGTMNLQLNNNSLANTYAFSAVLTTIGDPLFFAQRNASGWAELSIFNQFLAEAKAGDLFPYVFYGEYNNSSPGAISGGGLRSGNNWLSRYTDNSGSNGVTASSIGGYTPSGPSGSIESIMPSAGDAQDGDVPGEMRPAVYSQAHAAAGGQTRRGRLVDIIIAALPGTSVFNAKVNPASPAVPQVAVMGSVIVPCNTVPTE